MTAIKASLILAVALLASRAIRRRPASGRHCFLFLAIVFAAMTPVLERIAPGWGLAMTSVGELATMAAGRELLIVVWLTGAALALASLLLGFVRCRTLAAGGRSGGARARGILEEAARELKIVRDVRLIVCDRPAMPMTWGAFRPTILLPSVADTWSDDRLRLVLAHELAHVGRCDWALQIVVELLCCVHWFNPLFWIARAQLRIESDRACDDVVLTQGVDGADYAGELVSIARAFRASRDLWLAAPAAARAGSLERRLAAVLDGQIDRSRLTIVTCAATIAWLLALALPVAGFAMRPSDKVPVLALSGMQRDIMMRLGSEERRLHFVTRDVSLMNSRIEGRVELEALLGVDGVLNGVRLVEPVHPDLASAARAIVRQWRREPARVHGVPVQVPIRMTVDFRR